MKLQHELEMEEAGLEPHPEVDEDLEVEDNQGKVFFNSCSMLYIKIVKDFFIQNHCHHKTFFK